MALNLGAYKVRGVASASVADWIEFDSLPEDVRDLARRVLAARGEIALDDEISDAIDEAIDDLESAISSAECALATLRKAAK